MPTTKAEALQVFSSEFLDAIQNPIYKMSTVLPRGVYSADVTTPAPTRLLTDDLATVKFRDPGFAIMTVVLIQGDVKLVRLLHKVVLLHVLILIYLLWV